jgi:hypothetical protein
MVCRWIVRSNIYRTTHNPLQHLNNDQSISLGMLYL